MIFNVKWQGSLLRWRIDRIGRQETVKKHEKFQVSSSLFPLDLTHDFIILQR